MGELPDAKLIRAGKRSPENPLSIGFGILNPPKFRFEKKTLFRTWDIPCTKTLWLVANQYVSDIRNLTKLNDILQPESQSTKQCKSNGSHMHGRQRRRSHYGKLWP
jgi:hypothetical protein